MYVVNKDTIISKGYIEFLPFAVDDEEYMEETLSSISYVMKTYLDGLIQKDKYVEYLDFRKEGMFEDGSPVSIKEEDIANKKLVKSHRLPFYIHGENMRLTDALFFLEEQLNDTPSVYRGELEGLIIKVSEYYTTFDTIRPIINSTKMLAEFTYDKYYEKYKIKIKRIYDFVLETTIERLYNTSDIFSFSMDNGNEFNPFIKLLESVLKFPGNYPVDTFKTQHEKVTARLLIDSVIHCSSKDNLGCEPFSLEELRLLFDKHTNVEICSGISNSFSIYRELVPIIANNIMLTGKIN